MQKNLSQTAVANSYKHTGLERQAKLLINVDQGENLIKIKYTSIIYLIVGQCRGFYVVFVLPLLSFRYYWRKHHHHIYATVFRVKWVVS